MKNFKFQISASSADRSNFKLSGGARDGFTMGELIVAMSLFLIVISVASGTFIQGIRSQRAVVTSTSVNNNISQAMERMAREVRTGYDFRDTTASTLSFYNYKNERVHYTTLPDFSIGRCIGPSSSCTYAPITEPGIVATDLRFVFSGTGEPDSLPPRITMSVGVRGIGNSVVNFQTTVASRNLGN